MEIILKLIMSDATLLIINIVMLLLIVTTSIFLVKALIENNVLSQIMDSIDKSTKQRTEGEELLRKVEGIQDKQRLFYKIDLMLNQSGIKRKIRFLTTEYLLIFSLLVGLAGVISASIFKGFFYGIVLGFLIAILPTILIKLKADSNYRKTEDQLVHFLNLIENYTKTYDNIIAIFGKIFPYLQEPLSTAVRECYIEATNTGDMSLAFRKLEAQIGSDKFSEILRNLELCSRYEANYQIVVSTARDIMSNYIRSKRKVKSIAENARIELGIILFAAIVFFGIISSLIEVNLFSLLMTSVFGIAIVIYLILVSLYGIFSITSILRR